MRLVFTSQAIALLSLGVVASSAYAAILNVEPDGTGEYPHIRAAIEAALPGDIVLLADGTYVGPDNRNLSYLGKSIHVKSSSDDPTTCIIDCSGGSGYNRGFVFESAEHSGARLSGITVIGGHGSSDMIGGALYLWGTSPVISNCRFLNNTAYGGGAVYIQSLPTASGGTSPRFADCLFEGNAATSNGGAVTIWGEPIFENCRFVLNTATLSAGAVMIVPDAAPTFSNCEFDLNSSESGGCLRLMRFSNSTFQYCYFHDNEAVGEGAVTESNDQSHALFEFCTFVRNHSPHGPVESCRGITTYRNCTLYDNSTWNGVILVKENGHVSVERSIIAFSSQGAPIWCISDGQAAVECSNFFGNANGDWRYCYDELYDGHTNVALDPLFCDAENGDLRLDEKSWCAAGNNPGCGQVGAFGVGCSTTDVHEGSSAEGLELRAQPNPTSGECRISWASASQPATTLQIFDVAGGRVRAIPILAGATNADWDAKDDAGREVPAGVYLVRSEHSGREGTATSSHARVIVQR